MRKTLFMCAALSMGLVFSAASFTQASAGPEEQCNARFQACVDAAVDAGTADQCQRRLQRCLDRADTCSSAYRECRKTNPVEDCRDAYQSCRGNQ
jgi:hypothetical protein